MYKINKKEEKVSHPCVSYGNDKKVYKEKI